MHNKLIGSQAPAGPAGRVTALPQTLFGLGARASGEENGKEEKNR